LTRGDLLLLHCTQSSHLTPRLRAWKKKNHSRTQIQGPKFKDPNSGTQIQAPKFRHPNSGTQRGKAFFLAPKFALSFSMKGSPIHQRMEKWVRERILRKRRAEEEELRLSHIYPQQCHSTPLAFDGENFHFHSFFCSRVDRRSSRRQA